MVAGVSIVILFLVESILVDAQDSEGSQDYITFLLSSATLNKKSALSNDSI
jgi:hypothetical protein